MLSLTILALLLSISAPKKYSPDLAASPPMGWNSWNTFACDINENMVREMAEKVVELGLADLGYKYINLDDCWQST